MVDAEATLSVVGRNGAIWQAHWLLGEKNVDTTCPLFTATGVLNIYVQKIRNKSIGKKKKRRENRFRCGFIKLSKCYATSV